MKTLSKLIAVAFAAAIWPVAGFAQEIDSGDTAWILTSTALVLFMTFPGLSLFYGGLVRRRECAVGPHAVLRHRLCGLDHLGRLRLQLAFGDGILGNLVGGSRRRCSPA